MRDTARGREYPLGMPFRARPFIFAALLVMLASACAGGSGARKPSSGRAAPPGAPPVTCPLTGQQRPADFPISRPTVAIKIENSTVSRPQAGLEKADIVYEELAEGGITRFLALFHCSDASRVGPVRSARLVDPDILLEYAPVLFGYAGANQVVLNKVTSTSGVVDLRDGIRPKAYERVKGRKRPHNLFTSTNKLRDLSTVQGAPVVALTFRPVPSPAPSPRSASPSPGTAPAPPAAPGARPATSTSFSFGGETVRYAYDGATSTYLRFHGQTPHQAEGGRQLGAVNVVVLKVKVTPGTIRDAAGNVSPEIAVVGEGEATVLSQGLAVTGRWRRPSLSDDTRLVDAAGNPILLQPGNTWIHLVPEQRPVTVQ
jgi:hypothetical protein